MNKTMWKYVFIFGLMTAAWTMMWNLYGTYIPIYLQSGNPNFSSEVQSAGFGISVIWASVFLSIDEVIGMILGPLVGIISDRIRRRIPFVLYAVGVAVIGVVILPVVIQMIPSQHSGHFSQLIGYFCVFSIAALMLIVGHASINIPDACLKMELVPSENRTKIVGYISAFGVIFSIIFLALAPVLYETNPEFPFFVAAILAIGAGLCYKFFLGEPEGLSEKGKILAGEKQYTGFITNIKKLLPEEKKSLLGMLLCWFLAGMGVNSITTFGSSYALNVLHINEADTMYFVVAVLVGGFLAYIPGGHLAAKIGRFRTLRIGLIGLSVCGLIVFFLPIQVAVYIAFFLLGVSAALISVTTLPILSDIVTSQNMMGFISGCFVFVGLANAVIGNLICGVVIQATGSYNMLWIVVVCGALCGFAASFLPKRGEAVPKELEPSIENNQPNQ